MFKAFFSHSNTSNDNLRIRFLAQFKVQKVTCEINEAFLCCNNFWRPVFFTLKKKFVPRTPSETCNIYRWNN